jgi:hypothetical protein
MDLLFELFIIIALFIAFLFAAYYVMTGIAYAYFGFSIAMAPVLWALFIIGFITGAVVSIKNAVKAFIKVYGRSKTS